MLRETKMRSPLLTRTSFTVGDLILGHVGFDRIKHCPKEIGVSINSFKIFAEMAERMVSTECQSKQTVVE